MEGSFEPTALLQVAEWGVGVKFSSKGSYHFVM